MSAEIYLSTIIPEFLAIQQIMFMFTIFALIMSALSIILVWHLLKNQQKNIKNSNEN